MLDLQITKTRLYKSTMTSGDAFRVSIRNRRNGKRCWFIFNDNYRNESKEKDFLYALLSDAQAVLWCNTLESFLEEYGYLSTGANVLEGIKAFKGCKQQEKRLNKLFNQDEQEELQEMLQDY